MKGIYILCAAAGAGIGSAVTYFIMRKKLKAKNQEVIDIRTDYRNQLKEIQNSRKALDDMNQKKHEMMVELENKVNEEKLAPRISEEVITDYNAITKTKPVKKNNNPIKFISDAEAQKYSKDYELVGLTLYEDNVLIDDETENIVAEYEYWIGPDGIDNIRKSYVEGENIYILNETRKAIYDINVIDERFGDVYEPVEIE